MLSPAGHWFSSLSTQKGRKYATVFNRSSSRVLIALEGCGTLIGLEGLALEMSEA